MPPTSDKGAAEELLAVVRHARTLLAYVDRAPGYRVLRNSAMADDLRTALAELDKRNV